MFYVELDRKLLQGRNCVSGENLLKRPFRIEREKSIAESGHCGYWLPAIGFRLERIARLHNFHTVGAGRERRRRNAPKIFS